MTMTTAAISTSCEESLLQIPVQTWAFGRAMGLLLANHTDNRRHLGSIICIVSSIYVLHLLYIIFLVSTRLRPCFSTNVTVVTLVVGSVLTPLVWLGMSSFDTAMSM